MHPDAEPYPRIDAPPPDDASHRGLGRLVVLALVGGALAGLVGGLFRRAWCGQT